MTDSTPWQPPAGATPPVPPSPYAAPTGATPPPPGAAPGWTAPPKPGLIPLRPLTLGTLLAAAFQVLRRNPRPTFGFALLITGGIFLLTLVVVGVVSFFAISRTLNASEADAQTLEAGSIAIIILSALVPGALGIVGTAILQGVISLEVARGTVGEKLKLRGLWRGAKGRIGALIGWSLLITAVIIVGIAVLAGLIGLLIAFGGTAGLVIGVLLAFAVGIGAVVLFAWLGTKLSLVPSALMLERLPLRAAIARSWTLTNGYFWRTLGITLLVGVIIQVVASVLTAPLSIVFGLGTVLIDPNGTNEGVIIGGLVLYLLTIVFTIIFGAISAVVQSATPALIYIDLRMRKEGLDLELSRFVEARQAGDRSVADPYLTSASDAPATPDASPWQ